MEPCAAEQSEQFQYIATQLKRICDLLEKLVENTATPPEAAPPEAAQLNDVTCSVAAHRHLWGRRVVDSFQAIGIVTVQDLLSKTHVELLSAKGIGCVSLNKVRRDLRRYYGADLKGARRWIKGE